MTSSRSVSMPLAVSTGAGGEGSTPEIHFAFQAGGSSDDHNVDNDNDDDENDDDNEYNDEEDDAINHNV